MDLKDRKLISNGGLPKFELGTEYGVPTNGISDIVHNSNLIKSNIDDSNKRPVSFGQATKQINNSNVSSSFGYTPQQQYVSDFDKENRFQQIQNSAEYKQNSINSVYNPRSSNTMGQYDFNTDTFEGGVGTNLADFVVTGTNKFKPAAIPNVTGISSSIPPLEIPKMKIDNALMDAGAEGVKHQVAHKTSKVVSDANAAGTATKGAKAANIAGKALGAVQGVIGLWSLGNQISEGSKARINPEEMLMKYGTSNTDIGGGVSYERQNNINTASEMDQVKAETNQATLGMAMTGVSTGAAIGSILGPVGGAVGGAIGGIAGAIGGLFGGASRRRKEAERLRRANILANAVTNENRDNAFTQKIQKQVANKYGNQEDQLLYASRGAEYVMPDGLTSNNHNTQTAFGDINAPANALTQAGEKVVHKENGKYYVHKVTGSKNDSNYTFLFPNDSVITKKNAPYVEQAIQEGWYDKLLQKQALDREMKHSRNKISKYSLPGFARGAEWLGNAIPALTGFGIGLQQYNQAANQDVYKPNSFKQNQYIGALNDLDKLHIDYLPIANEQRAAEARVNRAIDYSGGLSTGQRATNRIASNLNTQNAIANGLMNWQKWNNELRSAAAKSRLEVGAQEAQRKQQAMQWDADTYAKGHAARQQGMQMGLYNMQNALEQYTANEFKRNQFNHTMDLYEQENQRKWEELWNKMGKGSSSTAIVGPTNAYQEQDRLNSALSTALSEGRLKGTVLDPIVKVDPLPKIPATMDEDFGIMDKLHPLKLGAKGDRVKTLQDRLNLLNKNNKTWTPLNSGIYDKATKNAVRQFQMSQFKGKKNSKQWDGIYGINTRNALMRALNPFNIGGI